MKQNFTSLKTLLIIILSAISFNVLAQTSGQPSEPLTSTSNVPAVGDGTKVYCSGSTIHLTSTPPSSGGPYTYHWYKLDASGNTVTPAAKDGTPGDYSYDETTTATSAGYFKYKLVIDNANGCSSPESAPLAVYVLPPINPTIQGANAICGSNQGTANLTVTGLDPNANFSYNYAWTKDGAAVGTNSATLSVQDAGTTAATHNYNVTVSFKLNSGCSTTSPQATVNTYPVPVAPTITAN